MEGGRREKIEEISVTRGSGEAQTWCLTEWYLVRLCEMKKERLGEREDSKDGGAGGRRERKVIRCLRQGSRGWGDIRILDSQELRQVSAGNSSTAPSLLSI